LPAGDTGLGDRGGASSRCIPSGVASPDGLRQRPPVPPLQAADQAQQIGPRPHPGLLPEERRGHNRSESEHVIKARQPPGQVDPVYAGHRGRSVINQGSHTQMIMRRPCSRHAATPHPHEVLRSVSGIDGAGRFAIDRLALVGQP
jgi:hypothetical protein